MNAHAHDRLTAQRTQWLKAAAERHGFMGAGIARAEYMEQEARRLDDWLSANRHGKMAYMANHFELRVDPTRLVPGARSVISLIYNYFPEESLHDGATESLANNSLGNDAKPHAPAETADPSPLTVDRSPLSVDRYPLTVNRSPLPVDRYPLSANPLPAKVSRYAYGEDYHKVLRRKLKALVREMQAEFGEFQSRVFVDSGPVLERDWARRSGQGWMGKNTMLIHPKKGSYFFLAEIILDLDLDYDHPIRDHCGTCRRCIDACPTEAISPEGYVLDGSKCISYLTIELREAIPDAFAGQMAGWIFGCDICQEVCPWNRFSTPHAEPAFVPAADVSGMTRADWLELTEDIFVERFGKTPLKRAGLEKLKDTARFLDNAK